MTESIEESELLALIEDELDASGERSLRRQLELHPDVLGLVEQLRADRKALCSADQPALPHDFLEDLEPLLARPILMQAPPGAYRRKHQRRNRARLLGRMSAAAAIVLLLLGGAWAAAINLFPDGLAGGLAMRPAAPAPTSPISPSTMDESNAEAMGAVETLVADGTIHHYQPLKRLLATARVPVPIEANALEAPVDVVTAPFAVVIDPSIGELEVILVATMSAEHGPVALVRNFSYDEARDIQKRWSLANAGQRQRGAQQPAVTDVNGRAPRGAADPSFQDLARRVREHLRAAARSADRPEAAPPSGVIAGASELAPDFELQIELSQRGAAYTIAVPVARLRALVQQLSERSGGASRLQLFDVEAESSLDEAGARSGMETWAADSPMIRDALRSIESRPGDTIVLLPVVTSAPATR